MHARASWTRRLRSALALCFAVLVVGVAACGPPPKVLIDQKFFGEARTAKLLMQRSPEGQFNQFLRICSLDGSGVESNCKDTLILENVVPGSMY